MAGYWPKFFGLRLRIKERGYYPAIDRKSLVNRGFYFVAKIFRFNTNQEY